MVTRVPGDQLLGRQRERDVLDRVLEAARAAAASWRCTAMRAGGRRPCSSRPFGSFVARRLLAERIVLLFAAREPIGALAGVAELRVEPLGRRDARALLDSVLPARLDERVLERIVVETHGNPLALLELPRGLTPAQLAGGFGLPAALPPPAGVDQGLARRRVPRAAEASRPPPPSSNAPQP